LYQLSDFLSDRKVENIRPKRHQLDTRKASMNTIEAEPPLLTTLQVFGQMLSLKIYFQQTDGTQQLNLQLTSLIDLYDANAP